MSSHGLETSAATEIALPVALAVTMVGMGMSLTAADFRRVVRMPEAVGLGLAAQVLLLPVLGVIVAVACTAFLGLSPALAVGVVLLACCPGGATSGLVTYLARADAALSVTITSFSSLLSPFLTPIMFLAGVSALGGEAAEIEVSLIEMAGLTFAIVAIPIGIGMLIRAKRPAWAARSERGFRIGSIVLLAIVIAGVIAQNRVGFFGLVAKTAPASLALNLLALGSGLGIGYLAKLGASQSRAIAIEVGFQNGTLGIALAITQLNSPEAALVPGFYSLVMFVTGGALAAWWAGDARRRGFSDAPAPEEQRVVVSAPAER